MRRFAIGLPLLILAVVSPVSAQKLPAKKGGTESVYDRAIKSVAWIYSPVTANSGRIGSGSLIDVKDRIVLTNYHVVGNDADAYVLFPIFDKDGQPVRERAPYFNLIQSRSVAKAKVLARKPKCDLAILQLEKLPKATPAIPLARESARTAMTVHCIGNSGASTGLFDYCKGEVRNLALARFRPRDADPPFAIEARMLEHSAPVNKGQSGGPVLNDDGELVAVTQGVPIDEAVRGIAVAVDVGEVKEFLKASNFGRIATSHATAVASATVPKEKDAPSPPAAPDLKAEAERRESAATFKLGTARELIGLGKKVQARHQLEDLIKNYGDSKAAAEAKKLLDEIGQ